MKKILLILLINSFCLGLYAQNRKGEFLLSEGCEQHQLYFTLKTKYDFKGIFKRQEQLFKYLPELKPLLSSYDYSIMDAFPLQEQQLNNLESSAKLYSGSSASVNKLRNIFKININEPTNERLFALALKLESLEGIDYASLMPLVPLPPPIDIAPATPDMFSDQKYMDVNPGVNMLAAWTYGLKGNGIRVRDIEYGFNKNHEDLNTLNQSIASGMDISSIVPFDFVDHGTAVSGVMNAPDNSYGVTGMVNEISEFILYPEYTVSGGYNRIEAINAAIMNSTTGDVILYEMQTDGPTAEYVPAEYNNVVWDLTKAATDANIIIVAAAGNGGENLDGSIYASYMSRGNSGAIIVGAGLPDTSHERASFSSYGSRINLQGWGFNVLTTGYGDFAKLGADSNQTYTQFSGTSSATPIVASCVVALQSYYFKETGTYLTATQLIQLLDTTGIPQGTKVKGNIGPLPQMEAAIKALKEYINTTSVVVLKPDGNYHAYPNPVSNQLYLTAPASQNSAVSISDVTGRPVYSAPIGQQHTVNMNNIQPGVYFLQFSQDATVQKTMCIIKQ